MKEEVNKKAYRTFFLFSPMVQLNLNPHRIWGKIAPGWDHDLHIHSNWSQDNLTGPTFLEYIPLAEKYKIHIGFAEHFEWAHYEIENPKFGKWKLTPQTVDQYLEEIDDLKAQFPHVTSGLEMDFYPNRISQVREFIDRYRNQFDFFLGSVHELEDFLCVTLAKDFQIYLEKYGGLEPVLAQYFQNLHLMIETDMFDAIAHPDVVYRFLTPQDRQTYPYLQTDARLLDAGRACITKKTLIEVNLSGLRSSWGLPFPNENVVNHLRAEGADFFVGSDSHSIEAFEKSILDIRRFNNLLRTRR
jgi:HisJ family histidinol phosphate phosphatase